jgi:hypothetical protein
MRVFVMNSGLFYTRPSARTVSLMVGRCKSNGVETRVQSAWWQRLKLKCDEQHSTFAFNFNLRRYTMDKITGRLERAKEWDQAVYNEVMFFPSHGKAVQIDPKLTLL